MGQFDSLEQISQEVALFKAEVEARGGAFDPMSVAVARSIHIVDSPSAYDQAIETRMAARRRPQNLARRPNFQDPREAPGCNDEVLVMSRALGDRGWGEDKRLLDQVDRLN